MITQKDLKDGDKLIYRYGDVMLVRGRDLIDTSGYAAVVSKNWHRPDLSDARHPRWNSCDVVLVERNGRYLQTHHSPLITKKELQDNDILYRRKDDQKSIHCRNTIMKGRTNELIDSAKMEWDVIHVIRDGEVFFTSANQIRVAQGLLKIENGIPVKP